MCFYLLQFAFKAILKHPNPFQCKKICLNTVGIITCSLLNPSRCMKGFFPLVLCVNAAHQHQLRCARGGFVLLETQTSSSAARWSSSAPLSTDPRKRPDTIFALGPSPAFYLPPPPFSFLSFFFNTSHCNAWRSRCLHWQHYNPNCLQSFWKCRKTHEWST